MKIHLFFLFVILSVTNWAQKPSIQLSVSDKYIEVGQVLSFTAKSNINGDIQLELPNEFIQGGTMNGMEQTMDQNGNMLISVNLTQEGVFRKEGKFQVYAFVKDKSKTHRSNVVFVTVKKKGEIKKKSYSQEEGDITKSNLKEPLFGIVEKSSAKVYEGEALVLRAKVYSRLNINMMQGYKSFALKGPAETYELDKSTNISLERENYKGVSYLTFSCGKQLVFPSNSGKFVVKPFSMALQFNNGGFFDQTTQIESNATMLEVLPLPKGAPSDFIGAVGKFEMESSLSKTSAKVGDIISLRIKISGTGNLHAIQKPKIRLPNGIVFYGDPEQKEELDYVEQGVTGFKSYVYFLKVNSANTSQLDPVSITYFHPESKKYITIKGNAFPLSISGGTVDSVRVAEKAQLNEKITKENISLAVPKKKHNTSKSSTSIYFILFAVLFLIILVVLFLRKKNKQTFTTSSVSISDTPIESTNQQIKDQQSDVLWAEFDKHVTAQEKNEALTILHKIILHQIDHLYGENFTTKEGLKQVLETNGMPESSISDLLHIINCCESSRFGILMEDVDCNYFKNQVVKLFF
jgi:hypothetical protein